MSSFSAFQKSKRTPSMTLVIPPTAFADDWEQRPSEDVAVGLRLLSERDIQAARRHAAELAVKDFTDDDGRVTDAEAYIETFNDALVREAVARALCDPNDITQPHPLLPFAQDLVQYAFTTQGVRFVWDNLHELTTKQSPVLREATDAEIAALARMLRGDVLRRLGAADARAVRKLLTAVLDSFVEAGVAPEPEPFESDAPDPDVSTYAVTAQR